MCIRDRGKVESARKVVIDSSLGSYRRDVSENTLFEGVCTKSARKVVIDSSLGSSCRDVSEKTIFEGVCIKSAWKVVIDSSLDSSRRDVSENTRFEDVSMKIHRKVVLNSSLHSGRKTERSDTQDDESAKKTLGNQFWVSRYARATSNVISSYLCRQALSNKKNHVFIAQLGKKLDQVGHLDFPQSNMAGTGMYGRAPRISCTWSRTLAHISGTVWCIQKQIARPRGARVGLQIMIQVSVPLTHKTPSKLVSFMKNAKKFVKMSTNKLDLPEPYFEFQNSGKCVS